MPEFFMSCVQSLETEMLRVERARKFGLDRESRRQLQQYRNELQVAIARERVAQVSPVLI